MSVSQYTTARPTSKRLTIIDQHSDPTETWEIQRFSITNINNLSQTKKKIDVKVLPSQWPFYGSSPRWLAGLHCVFNDSQFDHRVFSGHVDDTKTKMSGHELTLYLSESNQ